jgi:hypothetical protein
MNHDYGRNYLVTSFVCAKCQTVLTLSYNVSKGHKYVNDGITGGNKVDNQIAIHPCEKCYSEATKPLELIKQAMNMVTEPKK